MEESTLTPGSDNDTKPASPACNSGQRVALVTGDRICATCGFNLYGQPIVREPHYHMLAVRCPECGTVAAIQEYPILGTWGARWGRLFAATWFLIILSLIFTCAIILSDHARHITMNAVTPIAEQIAGEFGEHYRANQANFVNSQRYYDEWYGDKVGVRYAFLSSAPVDRTWWDTIADQKGILNSFPSSFSRYEWEALEIIWVGMIQALILGAVWSVVAASRKRIVTLGIALIISGLAVVASVSPYGSSIWSWWQWTYYASYNWYGGSAQALMVAYQEVGLIMRALVCGIVFVPLAVSMLFGRVFVRWLVIALLPPRSRGWLAFLWTIDGKSPPGKTWIDR